MSYSTGASSEGRDAESAVSSERPESARDLRHWIIVMIVFGVTGFSALVLSRVLFNVILGMEGSLWSGPWSYRILYLAVIPPFYYATLVLVASIFGKREYFTQRMVKVWSRLIPRGLRG